MRAQAQIGGVVAAVLAVSTVAIVLAGVLSSGLVQALLAQIGR